MRTIIISILLLVSCKKEVQEPTTTTQEPLCDCYEVHEVRQYTLVGTSAVYTWKLEYETEPKKDFCVNDNGTFNYDQSGTRRWYLKCN